MIINATFAFFLAKNIPSSAGIQYYCHDVDEYPFAKKNDY